MKIKFLGTGAALGIPAPFCSCRVCENARAKKGKDIRSRSGLIIDGQMMIDYSPDNFLRAALNGENLIGIKYFLITHDHFDHLDATALAESIDQGKSCNEQISRYFYGNEKVCSALDREFKKAETDKINIHSVIKAYRPITIGDYNVTALNAEHDVNQDCFVYLIQKDGKTYFHCCDSGMITEQTLNFLINTSVKLDAVVFDATFGLRKEKFYGHMNLEQVVSLCEKLREFNIINNDTKIYLTHVSHSGRCTHDELMQIARENGINVAYDGLEIEI
jgi:phosphoribosyl 1,2-cyclic phosphate phosphodiesterase